MKIGVDFDDCIADYCPVLLDYYNQIDGTSYKNEDVHSFDLGKIWKMETKSAQERCLRFYEFEGQVNLFPVFGVIDAISKLKENNELIIITGRPEHTHGFIVEWLKKYSINVFSEILFSNQFDGEKRGKAEICKDEGVDIFIDDNFQNILDVSKEKIKCFLMDAPWNQELVPEYTTRVKGWEEIVEGIEETH